MYTDLAPGTDIDALHDALFSGAIVRFRDMPEMSALVEFTRRFLEERLARCAPERVHQLEGNPAERYAALQREYLNCGETKALWRALFEAVGLDTSTAMRDRLTLRFQPPGSAPGARTWTRGTSTVGFHRDTWGTNLYAQVNWWAPVYAVAADRTFAILPELFAQPLDNDSVKFDIADIIERSRGRGRPVEPGEEVPQLLEEIDLSAAWPVTISPGELLLFSSQHAHVGIPNRTDLTRISLETRTLRLSDLEARRGAPNVDGRARWVAYKLFRRIADDRPLHEILGVSPFERFKASDVAAISGFRS